LRRAHVVGCGWRRRLAVAIETGPDSRNMAQTLRRTFEATPVPRLVVGLGHCGCDGGIFAYGYANCRRVASIIPADVAMPGCPPPPLSRLRGFLTAERRFQPAARQAHDGAAPAS
jgi:Ni,Fe-hydrogenase III small subunit